MSLALLKQPTLPNLPVPTLQETIDLLQVSLAPLAKTPGEFEEVKRLCGEFLKSKDVLEAHAELIETANGLIQKANEFRNATTANGGGNNTSDVLGVMNFRANKRDNHFLETVWDQMAYLAWQDSLCCYSNVFTTFFGSRPCLNYNNNYDAVLMRAVYLTLGIYDFGKQIVSGELEPESATTCFAQYYRILWTTRLPGEKLDRVVTNILPVNKGKNGKSGGPYDDRTEREHNHICVSYRGFWYEVDLNEETNNDPVSLFEIYKQIVADGDSREVNILNSVSYLTGNKRDDWTRARIRLKASSTVSAESVRSLEEAMFHVVLSSEMPTGSAELQSALCEGKGAWFDKSCTMIVFANGTCGTNLEHAAADAVVPSRMLVHANEFAMFYGGDKVAVDASWKFDQVYKKAAKTKIGPCKMKADRVQQAKRLNFDVDPIVLEEIAHARDFVFKIYADCQITTGEIKNIGSNQIKSAGMAPDTFMQLALQLAFYRDLKYTPATYETASTRSFYHGRTECIRSQSMQAKTLVTSIINGKQVNLEQISAAAKAHRDYLVRSSNGKGCDRHLLMIRLILMKAGKKLPDLYTNALMQVGSSYELSTSQLPWAVPDAAGFGAPTENAYGVCYRFQPNEILFTCASRSVCKEKNAKRFAKVIETAVADLLKVCSANKSKL